jgi:hypothetical protein
MANQMSEEEIRALAQRKVAVKNHFITTWPSI